MTSHTDDARDHDDIDRACASRWYGMCDCSRENKRRRAKASKLDVCRAEYMIHCLLSLYVVVHQFEIMNRLLYHLDGQYVVCDDQIYIGR